MNKKKNKCNFCNKSFVDRNTLYGHVENYHRELLPNDISTAQYLFNLKYKKEYGTCVICKGKTQWNSITEKYNRFCSNECKEKYRETFKNRMINTYGKEHLLNSPDQQRKMLANRKISGKYKWSDGEEIVYTGSYELNFLRFLDVVMNFPSTDIISPAPQNFYYLDENKKKHFYFPDFYIPSLNLIIEIKDGGDNPNKHQKIQEVDKKLEKIKDQTMLKQTKYNYIKVANNQFHEFIDYLMKLKTREPSDIFVPLVQLSEDVVLEEVESKLRKKIRRNEVMIANLLNEENNYDDFLYQQPLYDGNGDIIKRNVFYGVMADKTFPINNIKQLKNAIRNFKNCPPANKKELANSIQLKCKEYDLKINASSPIWNFIPQDKDLLMTKTTYENYHEKNCLGNDRYGLEHLTSDKVQEYPDIIRLLDEADNIYLSSDYHLFGYKSRKNLFTNKKIQNVDDIIIERQRAIVNDEDVFIFLGDLVNDEFICKEKLIELLSQLKGRKIIVLGNNDLFEEEFYYKCGFEYVVDSFKWKNMIFTHFPISIKDGEINFHGHIHGSRSYNNCKKQNHIDVYVDLHSYAPINIKEGIRLLEKGFFEGTELSISTCSSDTKFNKVALEESFEILNDQKIKHNNEIDFNYFNLLNKKFKLRITEIKNKDMDKNNNRCVTYSGTIFDKESKCILNSYVLGLKGEYSYNDEIEVRIIGLIEREDGTIKLLSKTEDNNRVYTSVQISALTFLQEINNTYKLYMYDTANKIIVIKDIQYEEFDQNSRLFVERLCESVSIIDDKLIIEKEKNNFMSQYMNSHRLLKIYHKTNNIDGMKYELSKLFYTLSIINDAYLNPNLNPVLKVMRRKHLEDANKARVFILNDFNTYIKVILEVEPTFNFSEYFKKTDFYKKTIEVTPEKIKTFKKLLMSVFV